MGINAAIDRAQTKRDRWCNVERKKDVKGAELGETLAEVRKEKRLKRGIRQKLIRLIKHPGWSAEARRRRAEQLADQIEALESQEDRLVERIDDLDAEEAHAKHLKAFYAERLERLRERRRRIEASHGDLSDNFSMAEFDCREGDPAPEYMRPHLVDLCRRVLEPMRARFGPARVTSGHRWSWYDARIGGVGGYHVYEKYRSQPAADLIFERGTPAEWAAYARSLGVGGVGQYNASGFVHVDTGPRRDWWG